MSNQGWAAGCGGPALQPSVLRRTFVQVVSVNVGLPREVVWKGMTVQESLRIQWIGERR
jgi:hypothetical protein